MLENTVTISNSLGLHARAAAQLVKLAIRFESRILLRRNDNGIEANAKSILSVLHLAAGIGVALTIIGDGPDEVDAVGAMLRLFADGFGEN